MNLSKLKHLYLSFFFLIFTFLCPASIYSNAYEPLSIHIVSSRNGVGLNKDIDIITSLLSDLGHKVTFVDSRIHTPQPKADINIFIQDIADYFFPFADKNYLLPNAEWLYIPPHQIAKYDKILCRTRESERIFKKLNSNAIFIGFTCQDRFDSAVKKNYKTALHLAGASVQKGTEPLLRMWATHPELPLLHVIRHKGDKSTPPADNIKLIYDYLPEGELQTIQNSCGLHICPSITEGYGHYIVEGLSAEAVVITTDAPPMNEFVSDPRCLVPYERTEPWRYATGYYADQEALGAKVASLQSLPENELKEIGRKNRELFLKKEMEFKNNIASLFPWKPVARQKGTPANSPLKEIESAPKNVQYLFIQAQIYKENQKYAEAIQSFQAIISAKGDERETWQALYETAECYAALNQWTEALAHYLDAYDFNPRIAEPLERVATYYRRSGQNHLAYLFAKQGCMIPYPTEEGIAISPAVYDYRLDEELSIAAYYTPFKDEGFAAADRIILNRKAPDDLIQRTKKNILFYIKNLSQTNFQTIEKPLPKKHEEGSLRFIKEGSSYAIRSFDPLVIDKMDKAGKYKPFLFHPQKLNLSSFKCAAAPLPLADGLLAVVYQELPNGVTVHRFLFLDATFNITEMSLPFTFQNKKKERCEEISYSTSADGSQPRLIMTVSKEGKEFFIASIEMDEVLDQLNPIPHNDSSLQSSRVDSLWEMTDTLWAMGIASTADHGISKDPKLFFASYFDKCGRKDSFQSIESGDIIWMRCCFVPQFQREILPTLTAPVVLVISDGDESFPSECGAGMDIEALLENPNIIHIFAQNCDYQVKSAKVSHLPIGLDFHTIAYRGNFWGEKGSPKEQEAVLNEILTQLKPTSMRKLGAFVDFQISDGIRHGDCKRYLTVGEDRTTIFNKLLPMDIMVPAKGFMKRSDLWRAKGEYAFSISPHGNGLDCHRTWEDLALGCIVIVKTSPLDPLYEGLPVVIVKDWNECTQANMKIWLNKYGDAFTNPAYRKKLTNAYWLEKIQSTAQPFKQKV